MAPPCLNDRYRVLGNLGAGSEGIVLLVADRRAGDARRALKRVRGVDADARLRLTGEFQRLAALRHPNLVRVYDLEVEGGADAAEGGLFFTADFVEGVPPATWLSAAPDPIPTLLRLAEDIASALAQVHAAGLLHADVKPGNIVVRELDGTAVLLDFGLSVAQAVAGDGCARGSLAYMSREALAGNPDARSDLYSLGATLYEVATGRPPFTGADSASLIRAICEDEPLDPTALAPWLPAPLAALIRKLLARDPALRHSSARVLLDDLRRLREHFGLEDLAPSGPPPPVPGLLPPALVGRDEPLATLAAALRDLAAPSAAATATRAIRLVGPAGVGRRALIDEAVRRHQLGAATGRLRPLAVLGGTVEEVLTAARGHAVEPPCVAAPASESAAASLARWVDAGLEALVRRANDGPVAIRLDAADARARALADAISAGGPQLEGARLCALILVEGEPEAAAPVDDGVLTLPVAPLSSRHIEQLAASMLGRRPAAPWAADLAAATGGIPALAIEVVRAATAAHGIDQVERAAPRRLLSTRDDAAVDALIVRRVAGLPTAQGALLEALAILGGDADVTSVAALADTEAADAYATVARLATRGFATLRADRVQLPSSAHTRAITDALPAARARALHRKALAHLEAAGDGDPLRRARHLAAVGPAAAAGAAWLAAADELERRGRFLEAADATTEAAQLCTGTALSEASLALARRATAVGRYARAIDAAARASRSRNADRRREALLVLARAQQRHGDLHASEVTLRKLLAAAPDDERAAGAFARLLVSRARYDEALEVAGDAHREPPRDGALPEGRASRLEAEGLARLYTNDLDGADRAFARLEAGAAAAGDRATKGRALALRGMVAQTRGDIPLASDLYATAHGEARAASDVHASAVFALNRATALSVRGRHGEAIAAIDDAIVQLRRLGDVAELAAAYFNRGVSLLALGELAAARRAADRALACAEAHDTPEMQIFAQLLDGDIARHEGALARASTTYQRALDLARERGQPRALLLARLNLAEVLAELGDARAPELLAEASADARAADDRDQLAVARARVALAGGADTDLAAAELEPARRHLRETGRLDLAWRADALAARLFLTRDDRPAATRALASARATFQELLAATPEVHRDGLRAGADAVALTAAVAELASVAPAPPGAAPPPVAGQEARLRRLLALSRRLNSELRLAPLLDDVIDTLIEQTSAERGFLLLLREGELDVEVARNFDQSPLAADELQVSRSIAARAARTGEPVLTIDAAFDDRFGAAASVAAMKLRSVLAVPLRQKGRVTGTIYLDHRFRRGAFTDDAVDLVLELADIAAVAIENARLVDENRRRQQEIAALNRRLEEEVVEKEAELATVKARLDARGEPELRHPYEAIVGRSPRMLEMLRLVDRAADTSLPVVVSGESGTGKELVARALHANGPRRDQPFVALNCGAVPEELLESELFGHVRGAFTGADRDRRGLFEVADRGTLFLDEVADTGLAMQAKLLRVLQEGELRRVGGDRVRRVDVRIVAASNRELRTLVDAGGFREDLFYRLNVLQIRVPPLRERIEDIPQLVEALLARFDTGDRAPRTVDRDAMARLCAYRWPGNVRELENELARAAALADGAIGVADLSPAVAAADPRHAPKSPDDLCLRPRVEALERALVEDAMERAQGNQTAAARLLGLSRYGLQKKLKRYGLAGTELKTAG